jgi:EpsI family protein
VLLLLVVVGQIFSDRSDGEGVAQHTFAVPDGRPRRWLRIAGAAGAVLLAAAAAPLSAMLAPAPQNVALPALAPTVAPPWREVPANPDWHPIVVSSARAVSQAFADGPIQIDRFIAIYRGQGRNVARANDRAADERNWSFSSARNGVLRSRSASIPVHVSTWVSGSKRRVVWSFYLIGGHPARGLWGAKWDTLRAYMTGTKCLSSYVALSEETEDQPASERDASRLLQGTEDLGSYLCGTSRSVRR